MDNSPLTAARIMRAAVLLILSFPVLVTAADYAAIGVTQNEIRTMLAREGLNPTYNDFPPLDGEPHVAATVWNPYLQIEMFGPEEGLTGVTLSMRPTSNENDAYWQSFVSLWLLAEVFPDWANKEEWFTRTIRSIADGHNKGKVEFHRDGHKVEMAQANGYLIFAITGREVDD